MEYGYRYTNQEIIINYNKYSIVIIHTLTTDWMVTTRAGITGTIYGTGILMM